MAKKTKLSKELYAVAVVAVIALGVAMVTFVASLSSPGGAFSIVQQIGGLRGCIEVSIDECGGADACNSLGYMCVFERGTQTTTYYDNLITCGGPIQAILEKTVTRACTGSRGCGGSEGCAFSSGAEPKYGYVGVDGGVYTKAYCCR